MRSPRTVLAILLTLAADSPAARIYYNDQPSGSGGTVTGVAPDGTGAAPVITYAAGSSLRGIAWHAGSGRIFLLDNGSKWIRSILPNGTGQQDIAPVAAALLGSDVEIDEAAAKLYWTESNVGASGNGFIRRANLDGSSPEAVVTTAPGIGASPYFLFVDARGGFLYWGVQENPAGGSQPTSYRRHTLAGVADTGFNITTPTRTRDIAIDPATATAYWADRQQGVLFRRAVAGGTNQIVLSGLNAPHGVSLDLEARKIYWADTGQRGGGPQWPASSARRVGRCNFDGSEYEDLTAGSAVSEPWDLTLDLASLSYADWKTRFFSTTTPLAGVLDDADGDGAPNLIECALVSHPRDAGSRPSLSASGAGVQYLRRQASNLTYRVEVSTDLAVWHFNGDSTGMTWTVESSVTAENPDVDRVVIAPGPPLAGVARLFYRIQVVSP